MDNHLEYSSQPAIPLKFEATTTVLLGLLTYTKEGRTVANQKKWLDNLGSAGRSKNWTPAQRAEVLHYWTSVIKAIRLGEGEWVPNGGKEGAEKVIHPIIFAVLERMLIEPFTEHRGVWYNLSGT